MFTPTPNYDDHKYWQPVINGKQAPDPYQAALIEKIEEAVASGLFYNSDVDKYVKENNDFIPPDAWTWTNGCEGGVMGMECYLARHALDEINGRKADIAGREKYPSGTYLGTVCINGKRYQKATVESYNENGWATITAKGGRYGFKFTVNNPRKIEYFIQKAISRGWRPNV